MNCLEPSSRQYAIMWQTFSLGILIVKEVDDKLAMLFLIARDRTRQFLSPLPPHSLCRRGFYDGNLQYALVS